MSRGADPSAQAQVPNRRSFRERGLPRAPLFPRMILFWQCTGPSWLAHRYRSQGALLLSALRAAHSLRHIFESGIPAAQFPERTRFSDSFVAALGAIEHQSVLAKFIAQFVDTKSAGHIADCYDQALASPSSFETPSILYKRNVQDSRSDRPAPVSGHNRSLSQAARRTHHHIRVI